MQVVNIKLIKVSQSFVFKINNHVSRVKFQQFSKANLNIIIWQQKIIYDLYLQKLSGTELRWVIACTAHWRISKQQLPWPPTNTCQSCYHSHMWNLSGTHKTAQPCGISKQQLRWPPNHTCLSLVSLICCNISGIYFTYMLHVHQPR